MDEVVFCAYVFGPEWEDIKYFRHIDAALDTLRKNCARSPDTCSTRFWPIVVSYRVGDDGTMHEKDVWTMSENEGDGEPSKRTASQEWGC
jgi:hypothetical protein